MKAFELHTFDGGRDLRPGQFVGRLKNRFKELKNYYVTKGKKLKRRPPVRRITGDTGTNAQGIIAVGGGLYTIAKKGDTVTFGFASPTITVLRFDNPDYCTTWTLLDRTVFNGYVVALIRHTFPGTTVTSRIFLHVFDGSLTKPTYVEDPYCPTSWAPTLPLHIYRSPVSPQVVGAFSDYTPYLATAGGKLCMSGPDGNVYFSRVRNARAWNTRSVSDFTNYGEWWYFVAPAGVGAFQFYVSEDFSRLAAYNTTWTAYALEYLDSSGTWNQMVETTAAPVADYYYFMDTVASRFAGGYTNEILLRVYLNNHPGTIFRLRMIIGPQPYAVGNVTTALSTAREAFNGTGAVLAFQTATITEYGFDSSTNHAGGLYVYVGGVLQGAPANYTTTTVAGLTKVTFAVAPPVGVNNVIIIQEFYVRETTASFVTYEGSSNILGTTFPTRDTVNDENVSGTGPVGGATEYHAFRPGGFSASLTAAQVLLGSLRYYYHIYGKTVWAAGAPAGAPTFTAWTNGSDTNGQSQFYTDKVSFYTNNLAGFGEAGFIPTSSKNPGGGLITQMSGANSRLLVNYRSLTELWSVNTNQTLDTHLDSIEIGTGSHASGADTAFYSDTVVLTARGIRAFTIIGNNNDNTTDRNIGEAIEEFTGSTMVAAKFWPWTGQLFCAIYDGSTTTFHVFDYSKESKISAWSKWTVVGIGQVVADSFSAIDDRLYFQVGTTLYYFDASSTSFRDDTDGATAYESRVQSALNAFDRPGHWKDFLAMDLTAVGAGNVSFEILSNGILSVIAGPAFDGTTYGQGRIDLAMSAQSIGITITSTDDTGSEIEALEIDYELLERV